MLRLPSAASLSMPPNPDFPLALQHRHEPHNNWSTKFEFSKDNLVRAKEIMARFPDNYQPSAMIPLLDLAQQQNAGFLSLAAMNAVASLLGVQPIRVYEVATFYTMFNRSPMGRYHIMVCGTTPCMLQGAKGIYKAISDHLGVVYGQTTEDKLFTLSEMECMGACVNAPMIAVAGAWRRRGGGGMLGVAARRLVLVMGVAGGSKGRCATRSFIRSVLHPPAALPHPIRLLHPHTASACRLQQWRGGLQLHLLRGFDPGGRRGHSGDAACGEETHGACVMPVDPACVVWCVCGGGEGGRGGRGGRGKGPRWCGWAG